MYSKNKCILPIFGAIHRQWAHAPVVVKDLPLHATQLSNVIAEVARDELLTAARVGKAGMRQLLSVGPKHFSIRTEEPVNVLCKMMWKRWQPYLPVSFNLLFTSLTSHFLAYSEACSGLTHVPWASSKTRPVAQGSSWATPFTQLKNLLQKTSLKSMHLSFFVDPSCNHAEDTCT